MKWASGGVFFLYYSLYVIASWKVQALPNLDWLSDTAGMHNSRITIMRRPCEGSKPVILSAGRLRGIGDLSETKSPGSFIGTRNSSE
jgi:hypothetical protein